MSPAEEQPDTADIPLSDDDRRRLQEELARIYDTPDSVARFLAQIGFPIEWVPIYRPEEREKFWSKIFTDFGRGVTPSPYRRAIAVALERHGSYHALADLAQRYKIGDTLAASAALTCHLIVWVEPDQRPAVRQWLDAHGLDPRQVWENSDGVSYRLNEADDALIRARLNELPGLRYELVRPGADDSLIEDVVIRIRAGRELRMHDVPVQQRISDLAESVVRQYPAAHLHLNNLNRTSLLKSDGSRRSLDPNGTLAEQGYRTGDQVEMNALSPTAPIRIFFIGANPRDMQPIQPEMEARQIRLAAAEGRHLKIEEHLAAQPGDLENILQFRPDILHFACHSEEGNIILQEADGYPHPVLAADVAEWLQHQTLRGRLRLSGVVLAACRGELIAPAFVDVAHRVIAHKKQLSDGCALGFTLSFYRGLRYNFDLRDVAESAAKWVRVDATHCAMIAENLIVLPARTRGGR